MITGRELNRIRRRTMRPIYPFDKELTAAAAGYDKDGRGIYATIQNPATELIYRYLSEFAIAVLKRQTGRPPAEIQILDWGGGKGYTSYFLKLKKADTVLYETTEFSHTKLWRHFDIKVKTTKAGELPFADKTFDGIISFGVLEHVPYDYEALKEVNRVLKDDGLFFCFNLPNQLSYLHKVAWWRGVHYHDRLYSGAETRQLLKRAGFNIVGRPWRRQLMPKGAIRYGRPRFWERLDLSLTNYTPLGFFATSLEFVARKQRAYVSEH